MARIFISYRRDDSKHAVGRLHAALRRHVAKPQHDIFIDIDNIPKGVDFADYLESQIAKCDVMLAIIGPSWLDAGRPASGARRLDDPDDFVRMEVAAALKRGIPVVPVLLDDTPIPSPAALPSDLRALTRRNGERLHHESFEADVERLLRGLPVATSKPSRSRKSAHSFLRAGLVLATAVAVVGAGLAWTWFASPKRNLQDRATQVAPAPALPDTPAGAPGALASASSPSRQTAIANPSQAAGECGDVTAVVRFEFDSANVSPEAQVILEAALRRTFDCVLEQVVVEAHEDLGSTAAYAQKLSERRAEAIAAVLVRSGVPETKITRIGYGSARPLEANVSSPLNRRASISLSLSRPNPQP